VRLRLTHVAGCVLAGVLLNIAATLVIAQFSNNLPACASSAQEFAVRKVMREPNPSPPIWPEFNQRGWGVSYVGLHPPRTSASGEPDSYIRVLVQVGYPLRCVSTSMEYKKLSAWSDPAPALTLATRRDHRGKLLPRTLPLDIQWAPLAVNSFAYAAALFIACWSVVEIRRLHRRRRHLCPSCAYPIGAHPVCTECGAALSEITD